jgi:hypothetical protein
MWASRLPGPAVPGVAYTTAALVAAGPGNSDIKCV